MTEVVADTFQMLESKQLKNQIQTAAKETQNSAASVDPLDLFGSLEPMNINDRSF